MRMWKTTKNVPRAKSLLVGSKEVDEVDVAVVREGDEVGVNEEVFDEVERCR